MKNEIEKLRKMILDLQEEVDKLKNKSKKQKWWIFILRGNKVIIYYNNF